MLDLADGLTRSQHAAVDHQGGPLLVTGAAGSGRTTVLEHRFAALVGRGAAAARVLVLAASPDAAASMRLELLELIPPPYDELGVDTFGSFCARVLRAEASEAGLDPDFVPVAPAERVALLLESLGELSLRQHEIRGNPAPLLAGFVSRIDRLKEEMVSPDELIRHAADRATRAESGDDAARTSASRELEFAHLYADHERLLANRGALDTGDLVLRVFRLLHQRPHVRSRVAAGLDAVLVDDYQDANFARAAVLALLCEEVREVTVTGDPAQAIGPARAGRNLDDFLRAFPDAVAVDLGHSLRCPERMMTAARAALGTETPPGTETAPGHGTAPDDSPVREGGEVRFWRCASDRAQAQAVAAEVARLVTGGTDPARIAVLLDSAAREGAVVCSALEERALPFRLLGSAAYFQRAEVRDVLAWLRLLADPSDSGAAVRALARPPVGLHSVDIARLTQLARRRKLDMPAAVGAALEGPQLTPEGRDRAQVFLRLYRPAAAAFEDRRPDAFVLRLIERVGIRRQQVFATQADTVERLRNIAALPDLATSFMRREPNSTPRDFARYLRAVADSGLEWDEVPAPPREKAVQVLDIEASRGREFDHAFVLGLSPEHLDRGGSRREPDVPSELVKHRGADDAPGRARRLVHVASTRAREGLVLSFSEPTDGRPAGAAPAVQDARAALALPEEPIEEELFGPAEGLHSAFRTMRDELLDTVAQVGGRLGEMRLDAAVDVDHAVARFLELVKVAALIDRSASGQEPDQALSEVNALLAQGASFTQREMLEASTLDGWLRDAGRDAAQRPVASTAGVEPSLDPFIPRRGDGVMLSASDIETYRLCPLKYKFARVFRIPQEPTIHQRFGIVLHQVLERFHQSSAPAREDLFELFESSWRRGGFGDTDDELQFRERALSALDRYWERVRDQEGEPAWFERSFSFQLGPHLLRGRVDRVDRLPDGTYELIDYKTGKAKSAEDLRQDIQLSVYQMGARESWGVETSAQSYMYVMTGEKVPVAHSEEELERVRGAIEKIGSGILRQEFQPTPTTEICSFCDYRIICPAAER
ncbi:MAG: ATP-dependent helicase [Thermoleophilaceae bacterium]|nr:ATP-dependent helicase [Thermoleophilaceae bacterium]